VLYERLGSKLPSPPGRPSATERYPTREDYAAAVRTAAEMLVAERFLLPEDVDAIVDKAIADYCRANPFGVVTQNGGLQFTPCASTVGRAGRFWPVVLPRERCCPDCCRG
jgi:Alpha/beta hydrolase domain